MTVVDTIGAIRAYEHDLAFRTDPEPSVLGDMDWTRAELAALAGERGR